MKLEIRISKSETNPNYQKLEILKLRADLVVIPSGVEESLVFVLRYVAKPS